MRRPNNTVEQRVRRPIRLSLIAVGGLLAWGAGAVLASAPAWSAAPVVSFKQQIQPIFQQHCVMCHNPGQIGYKSIHLDLSNYEGVMAGSTYGAAVIPHQPQFSPLIAVLKKNGHAFKNLNMPPLGPPLSAEQIELIGEWIRQGAKDN